MSFSVTLDVLSFTALPFMWQSGQDTTNVLNISYTAAQTSTQKT